MKLVGIAFGSGSFYHKYYYQPKQCEKLKIKELLPAQEVTSNGTVVLATVKGDIHDLGKNIVAALMRKIMVLKSLTWAKTCHRK